MGKLCKQGGHVGGEWCTAAWFVDLPGKCVICHEKRLCLKFVGGQGWVGGFQPSSLLRGSFCAHKGGPVSLYRKGVWREGWGVGQEKLHRYTDLFFKADDARVASGIGAYCLQPSVAWKMMQLSQYAS